MKQEMNFEFTEELQLFRDEVRKWVDKECPKDWCRAFECREYQYPQALWDKLTEAGSLTAKKSGAPPRTRLTTYCSALIRAKM
jgi:alkylation response protein AidB-like acyl-CoA dehydrogenase